MCIRDSGILDADVDTGIAGELLGDVEGLRVELLNLTGTVDRKALLLGQLVHTPVSYTHLDVYKRQPWED